MANFLKGLAETFDPTLISNTLIKGKERQQEADRESMLYQRAQRDKDVQEQREIDKHNKEKLSDNALKLTEQQKKMEALQRYMQGGTKQDVPNSPLMPKSNDIINNILTPKPQNNFIPDDASKKVELLSQTGLTPEQIYDKLNPKKEYNFIHKPNATLAVDKKTGQIDFSASKDYGKERNPLYKPIYKEREISTDGYDPKSNKLVSKHGLYDYEAGEWRKDEKGKPIVGKTTYTARSKRGTNGETFSSKEYDKRASFKFAQIIDADNRGATAKTQGFARNSRSEKIDAKPEEFYQLSKELGEQYADWIKRTGSENFNSWANTIYNTKSGKSEKSIPKDPKFFWDAAQEAFKKDLLNGQDLHSARLLYQATYHKDPIDQYGIDDSSYDDNSNDDNSNDGDQDE